MSRRKPEASVSITSLEAADTALAEIARLDRDLKLIEISLNEDIDAAKASAAEMAAPLTSRRELLELALKTFAKGQKDTLFEKVKSRRLLHGIIGFRASKELVTMKGFTWEKVKKVISDMGSNLEWWAEFGACIRPKYEVDKEAVKKLPEERMALIGCALKPKDTFFYETKEETVAADQAA